MKRLVFPEEYFKTEVKAGFTVNELMKRAWAAQLEVLNKMIEICEKYDLTYYAYWGTLLGAVRHQGYIPWDDDLDIAMKKEDYIKFLEVAKQELPEGYCILNPYTEVECDEVFTRITNGNAIDFSDEKLQQYHGCPFVVGVDIFPLYYVPGDSNQAEIQKIILQMIGAMTVLLENIAGEKEAICDAEISEGLEELTRITGYQFTTDKPIKNQLAILYDQIGRLYGEEESDAVTIFPLYLKKDCIFEKELLTECVQMPFDNMMLNAPNGYDEILKKLYGDYMVPKIVRDFHDYPCYKGQLQSLGMHIEKLDCAWKKQSGMQLPQDWQEKIKGKKVILYHTSADALMCHSELAIEKMRHVFETAKKNPDVILWWFPCLLDTSNVRFIKQMTPQLVKEYRQIMDEFCAENWGIYDVTGDRKRVVEMADSYYGDESELLELFQKTGKSVTIQDYEKS